MHKVSDDVRSTHSQDGGVVLDIQQGQMFNLNLVGSRILELLKSGANEADITETISVEFDVSRQLVEADVREFITTLEKHGLVGQHA
jgi:hypothetical protein